MWYLNNNERTILDPKGKLYNYNVIKIIVMIITVYSISHDPYYSRNNFFIYMNIIIVYTILLDGLSINWHATVVSMYKNLWVF